MPRPYHHGMKRTIVAIVVAAAALASAWIFLSVDAGSHSASDTLYGSVVPIGLVWLIALALLATTARTMKRP